MAWHFGQHFGEQVKEKESVDTLRGLFQNVSCFLLPSPGLKVAESRKRRWDGGLDDIDEDFVRFLDELCKEEVFGTKEGIKVNQVQQLMTNARGVRYYLFRMRIWSQISY